MFAEQKDITLKYIALFDEEKKGFGVSFPDFPDCSTYGESLDEAVDQAHEALALYIESFIESGKSLPEPRTKKMLLALPENKGKKAINIIVEGNGSDFEEFEVVMHSHLLKRIEKYCKEHGLSPADFLAIASRELIKADPFGN
jgi:predicted RNase H-like HicB family nuclease